jgi:hypothetical protein
VGARDASDRDMEIDPDAYNSLGEHLPNDQKHSRRYMVALVFAAALCIAFLLWMVYWSPS